MMPEQTVLQLSDELGRLDAELDDLAAAVREADDESLARAKASEVQVRYDGVASLVEEYGESETITISPHTAGSFARVEDKVAEMRQGAGGPVPGASRNVNVAEAVDAAPFIPNDVDPDNLEEMVGVISNLPVGVVKYLDKQVNEASRAGSGNCKPFDERLLDSSGD